MTQEAILITTTPPLPGLSLVNAINDANLTIATNFAGSDDPAAEADAYMTWADTATGFLKRRNSANSAWTIIGRIYSALYEDASGNLGLGNTNPTEKLDVTGNAKFSGTVVANYSDKRLKTKIGNIENALNKICLIETFYYEPNDIAQSLGYKLEREIGVSAQSVDLVFPEAVAPAPIDAQYLTVRYERLVAPIIEAIKELRAEVKAIKGE